MKKRYLIAAFTAFMSVGICAQPVIITNIQGYTPQTNPSKGKQHWLSFKTLVFEQGKVLATGDDKLLKQYPQAKVIDGHNKTLIPGLIDAHGHVVGLGYNQLNLDVRGTQSVTDMAQAVNTYAKAHPQLSWIKGRGWNQELWANKQYPTAKDLDEHVADKPVWLRRVDGHAGVANKKALALAGIGKETLDPNGGKIERYSNGEPTGVLIDNAMNLLEDKIPAPTKAEDQAALDLAMTHMLSLGLTSVHDAGIKYSTYNLYKENMGKGSLDVRIYGMINAVDPNLQQVLKAGYISDDSDMLSIRSVKLWVDGALGSRGAALIKPYSDAPTEKGLVLINPEQMALLFNRVLGSGFQLNVHAIGDKGNQVVLNQFEQSFKQVGGQSLRNRIEHAQVVALEDIPRFKQLKVIPSMQQTHATSDMNMAETRVGPQRIKGSYAWRKFLDQGSKIAGGSDFPVELANPFYGIHAAVTRQDRQNQPKGGWYSSEAMTLEEALTSFTIDAAYAAHQENMLGSLEPGKWADFILLDRNIFTIAPEQLWQTQVLQTFVAGELKYAKDKQ